MVQSLFDTFTFPSLRFTLERIREDTCFTLSCKDISEINVGTIRSTIAGWDNWKS